MDSEFGPNELYNMVKDPYQKENLAEKEAYKKVIEELDKRLTEFYTVYTDTKYDLWNGGTASG